jgi:hypothetical protein
MSKSKLKVKVVVVIVFGNIGFWLKTFGRGDQKVKKCENIAKED